VSGLTGTPIMRVARAAVPFVLAMVTVTFVVAFVPELSLWLLRRG
jgi:C4-dicarboxylate transporter, DctM subunit